MSLRPAATVLLLREDPFSVFMLQRNRRMGFLPSAWVFPGGRVDPGDSLDEHGDHDDLAFRIAALRETFEEAGIWLGENAPPDATRDPLNRGELVFRELIAEHGSTLDLDSLAPWSWWVTPEAEPRRYDTRFYVVRSEGHEGAHDQGESVDSRWIEPAWAMQHGSVLDFPMAPPTWWTLHELAQLGSVDAVLEAAGSRPQRPIMPIMRFFEEGMQLLLPGHPDHPEPPFPGLPREVGYADGHWVAIHDGEELRAPR